MGLRPDRAVILSVWAGVGSVQAHAAVALARRWPALAAAQPLWIERRRPRELRAHDADRIGDERMTRTTLVVIGFPKP
jgi:hypothetical protein